MASRASAASNSTARVVREMRGICQGVHIMAIGWEAEVPQILAAAGVRG